MKINFLTILLTLFCMSLAHAGGFFTEDFEKDAADWQNKARTGVTHHSSGGHDGGAYISTEVNLGAQGGTPQQGTALIIFRCAVAPNQLPSQNCSQGDFADDWLTKGVATLSFWIRHNSANPQQIFARIPTPNNNPGASVIWPTDVVPNTWTQMSVTIVETDPLWDTLWGGSDFNTIFSNIGRLQPGIRWDYEEIYSEPGSQTIDIDDVQITGTAISGVVIVSKNNLHVHHKGIGGVIPNDNIPVVVLGQSILAGDPVDLDTSLIDPASVRLGPWRAAIDAQLAPLDYDNDGIDDAKFRFKQFDAGGTVYSGGTPPPFFSGGRGDPCSAAPARLDGELTTDGMAGSPIIGVFTGFDNVVSTDCDAPCH